MWRKRKDEIKENVLKKDIEPRRKNTIKEED